MCRFGKRERLHFGDSLRDFFGTVHFTDAPKDLRRSQGSQTLLCPKIIEADALRFLKLSQSTYSYELILKNDKQ